jgi:hypothetical protein
VLFADDPEAVEEELQHWLELATLARKVKARQRNQKEPTIARSGRDDRTGKFSSLRPQQSKTRAAELKSLQSRAYTGISKKLEQWADKYCEKGGEMRYLFILLPQSFGKELHHVKADGSTARILNIELSPADITCLQRKTIPELLKDLVYKDNLADSTVPAAAAEAVSAQLPSGTLSLLLQSDDTMVVAAFSFFVR